MSAANIKLERILDTTLREGEQTPTVQFREGERSKIAMMLLNALGEKLYLEVGFAYNTLFADNVRQTLEDINSSGRKIKTLLHARAKREDIDVSYKCGSWGVAIYLPLSDEQLKYKLNKSYEWALNQIKDVVGYAKSIGFECVQYTLEDATAVPIERVIEGANTALDSGADVIRLADTSSRLDPWGFGEFVEKIVGSTPEGSKIDVHCHNDRGLAVANAIAGLRAGATGVHTTVLGIGERCGIPDLITLIEDLESLYGVDTGVNHKAIPPLYYYVSACTGIPIPKNHPVIGEFARTHKAGTHQTAVLKQLEETGKATTYEVVDFTKWGLNRMFELSAMQSKELTEFLLKRYDVKTDKASVITETVRKLSMEKGRPLTSKEFREIVKECAGEEILVPKDDEQIDAIVGLKTKPSADEVSMMKEIRKICLRHDAVCRIYEVTGTIDYFVDVKNIGNMETLDAITNEIRKIPGIVQTETYIVLNHSA
jgi:isopropylmalate/homocitrate/citramalate synthase